MVYRKTNVKRKAPMRKRKVVKRKFVRRAPVPRGVTVQRNIPAIQKHRYTQIISLDPGLGTIASYAFSANNLNKPNVSYALGTNGSHQPMRLDQMALFYKNFTVIGAKIMVQTVGQATSPQSTSTCWGVRLQDSATVPFSNYQALIENGKSRWKLSNMSATSNNQTLVSQKFSCKKFFNLQSVKDNFDRVGAVYDNSGLSAPYQQGYFVIWSQAMDPTLDATLEQYLVTIDYITLWSEPSTLVQS